MFFFFFLSFFRVLFFSSFFSPILTTERWCAGKNAYLLCSADGIKTKGVLASSPWPTCSNAVTNLFRTHSDQRLNWGFDSFDWHPSDKHWATLFKHIQVINSFDIGNSHPPTVAFQTEAGRLTSLTKPSNMLPLCWPDKATSRATTWKFRTHQSMHTLHRTDKIDTCSLQEHYLPYQRVREVLFCPALCKEFL